MQFKKILFVLAITTTIIFGLMFGSTYAYYVSTNGTSLNVTTGDFDSSVAVVFNQSEYINTFTGVPISSSEVETKASKTIFTLVPDSSLLSDYEVAVNISLVDIEIANELKVADFKYKLTCNNGTTTNLKSGTGVTIGTNESIALGSLSTSDGTFNVSKASTCTLYVWLQDSGANQNSLMNKNFSGLVKVNFAFRK